MSATPSTGSQQEQVGGSSCNSSTAYVTIVGAGIIGLTMAKFVKREFGAMVDVTVVAENFYAQTTTYGSGGYWMPYAIGDDMRIIRWGKDTYDDYLHILSTNDGARAGIQMMPSFQLYERPEDVPDISWRDAVIGYRLLDASEISRLLPSNTKYRAGYTFMSMVADQKYYLQYLTEELRLMGVNFVQKRIASLTELSSSSSSATNVVINCCGLAGDQVCTDDRTQWNCYPIRGQVLRVKAPWIRAVWGFGTSYIIPNMDSVVLGGTAQRHDSNINPTLVDSETILADIYVLFPSLQEAKLDNIWVGLRPGRDSVRCGDGHVIKHESGECLVTHCYGHGGSGITLAAGCAMDVVKNHIKPFLHARFLL